MSKWTGRRFSTEEIPHLAEIVVRSVALDYEDKNRVDRVMDFQKCGNAIYVAVERIFKKKVVKKTPVREVSAVIIPVRIDGLDVRWREVHESTAPQEALCPARILNVLTPTQSEYALEWRKACRMNHARAWRQQGIHAGLIVVTDSPLPFSGSHEAQIFRREADRDVYSAIRLDGEVLFKCRIPPSGFGLDFTVFSTLDLYREFLKQDSGFVPEDDFEPWLPQVDDVLESAQMTLFS